MRDRLRRSKELHLERMFETRSEAWEKVGLNVTVNQRQIRRARIEIVVLVPVLIAVLVLYAHRDNILGKHAAEQYHGWIQWGTVVVLLVVGWTLARAIGRAAGPTMFRRMDPGTAGTVGFIIRLITLAITVLIALSVAGVNTASLVAGSAFTAVVLGLAAQQTLGNLFAGLVLLTARPFRVGERVRLQAGALGGIHEGIVSSLGLMYTTLARGADQVMIPNSGVISAVVVPLREPEPVDVRVRISSGIRPSQVQAILDEQVSTLTRSAPHVLLEEIDGDDVVVRVQATPEHADEGAQLADEVIAALSSVTGEHEIPRHQVPGERGTERHDGRDDDRDGGEPRASRAEPGGRGEPATRSRYR
jgi:small conductance mechanosensitive channel